MAKLNLPVIILKGIVLLPNNEVRFEFDSTQNKTLLETSEMFSDNKILVVPSPNPLEEVPALEDLPLVGTIAEIHQKMELPNNKIRVLIKGLDRAYVESYLNINSSETLESIVTPITHEFIDTEEESVLTHKLAREIEDYIRNIPYVSNGVLSIINNTKKLDEMTDIIAPHLPITYLRLIDYLKETNAKNRCSMILEDIYKERQMYNIERQIDSKVQKEINDTQKEYYLREQIKAIKDELGDSGDSEVDKFRDRLKKLEANDDIKKKIKDEISKYENMNPNSPDMGIESNYINWMLDLPWNHMTLDNNNLKEVKESLDKSHYGLEDVKKRIIEFLAVKEMTNSLTAPIICLVGPPGTGKTSLAISIAHAINRKFVKMSVGGVNDEAEIKGHRRAYVGSAPGRVIKAMKQAGSANPLFLIDEIDKMTTSYQGDPASALLEVLDPEQNKYFSDNYIEEPYDLSNVLFIATANNINDIPGPLRDRLEVVELNGYTEFEKLDIAKKYLLPKTLKSHGLNAQVDISDANIVKIIDEYTKEAGVRELERDIATIIRKIVTNIVITGKSKDTYKITYREIKEYLGLPKYPNINHLESKVGVVNGLAYTPYGGDVLPIEVNYYPGKGDLVLTGSLGDVMKESARIAYSYVKANAERYGIDYNLFTNNDIHIHVPEGAIPKDGPSAGIALTTALISTLTNKKISSNLAMTGEITLRGDVIPIGGLKEKSIGALRNGIKTIIIPYDNMNDLIELPKEVKDKIKFIPVHNYNDVTLTIQKL
jgi:ATP-dependent Lon protease